MTVPDLSGFDPKNNQIPAETSNLDTSNNTQSTEQVTEGHPAWKEILDVLPTELHGLVRPTLENWDKGVQDKIQSLHSEYDDYKPFKDADIGKEDIEQALWFAQELEKDPSGMIQKAIDTLGLDFVAKAAIEEHQQQQQDPNSSGSVTDPDDPYADLDIENHPKFKEMQAVVQKLSGTFEEQESAKAAAKAQKDHEDYLAKLAVDNKDNGEFDPLFVTALMQQGIDGDEAVKRYYNTINQAIARAGNINPATQQQQAEPPTIMGGNGTEGSGVPSNPIDMGSLKPGSVEALVVNMLNQSNET